MLIDSEQCCRTKLGTTCSSVLFVTPKKVCVTMVQGLCCSCFICHAKKSVGGNGTGSMGGRHVDSAGGLGSGGST